jgi:hypothetical protein
MGGGSEKAFCEAKPLERGGAVKKNLSILNGFAVLLSTRSPLFQVKSKR